VRHDIAYLLMVILAIATFAVILFTLRYNHYLRQLNRGRRHARRVWKPFWMR
jgi:hypothetical protein